MFGGTALWEDGRGHTHTGKNGLGPSKVTARVRNLDFVLSVVGHHKRVLSRRLTLSA